MKIRKLVTFITVVTMAMGMMTGCGANGSDSQSTQDISATVAASESESTQDSTESASATETNTNDQGKVLVVYYSATGSTKTVAETIADTTGGDLFEITPKEPYTSDDLDWSDDNSRVSREHEDESLRDVELTTTTVDNWDSYDTVLIGYPIWWGTAAWPVDNFVKDNDFTGKTVIPFCTSASSGIGQSGSLLADMAGTGDWLDGERFSSGASEEEVQDWVKQLGYAN